MDLLSTNTNRGNASAQEDALLMETFLEENYHFRRNILSGKTEYAKIAQTTGEEGAGTKEEMHFQILDKIALNSIVRRARLDGIIEKNPRPHIDEYVYSDAVESYNPIESYLNALPVWDGHDHVADVLNRIPGLTSEKRHFFRVWLRSTLAHWLQLDTLHGNECVPTLIGAQGCGKSTFVQRLLPKELRCYFLDHLNLSNKFDKEMALTNNLIVNLDELDAIRPSQHAALKQTLSKSKVNGRVIFGNTQEDRPRFASFVATTNNVRPLNDPTGSRRYICIQIPTGAYINNVGEINYEQFYAQVLDEVVAQKLPYWFDNDQVARIQELNLDYMAKMDLPDIITHWFRKPSDGETSIPLSSERILEMIAGEYPNIKYDRSTKVVLGLTLKNLGYQHKESHDGMMYFIIPKKSA